MNVTFVPAQIVLPGLAEIVTDGVAPEVTFIVIPWEVAVAGLAQGAVEVITTLTTSPFTNPLFE